MLMLWITDPKRKAPTTFEPHIREGVAELVWHGVLVYIKDIPAYRGTWELSLLCQSRYVEGFGEPTIS